MKKVVVHEHGLPVLGVEVVELNLVITRRIAHFGMQRDGFYLWEYHEIDLEHAKDTELFCVVGTGEPTPPGFHVLQHHGTCLEGRWVWHLFELARDSNHPRWQMSTDSQVDESQKYL